MNGPFCQLEVKASLDMYPISKISPENVVLWSFSLAVELPERNKNMPTEIKMATEIKKKIWFENEE